MSRWDDPDVDPLADIAAVAKESHDSYNKAAESSGDSRARVTSGQDQATALRAAIRVATKNLLTKPKPNRQQRRAAARRKQASTDQRTKAQLAEAMRAKTQEART